MQLLKLSLDHLNLFEGGTLSLDFYCEDRVPADDQSAHAVRKPLYTNKLLAIAGINATGKSTLLNLIELTCRAMKGESVNGGGLPSSMPSLFHGTSTLRCAFVHEDKFFYLKTELVPQKTEVRGNALRIGEELIGSMPLSKLAKGAMRDWDEIESRVSLLASRDRLPESWYLLLSDDRSICAPVLAQERGRRGDVLVLRDGELPDFENGGEKIDRVLRVFDPKIEHLEVKDGGRSFVLHFEGNRDPMYLSLDGLKEVLSSGTLKGLALIQRALVVLERGGYFLVDEVENHLNSQLVNVVLDLFASDSTNPRGAVMVFTTHYSQLLDHVRRKDNVYFLARATSGLAEAVKYSDRVKRIENKKSEVFNSNFVRGTAPRYFDVKRLKELVAEAVLHE